MPSLGDPIHLFGGFPCNPNIRCDANTFPFCIFINKGQNCGLTTVLTTTVRISFSASNSISGCGPVGRALDLGSRCREFESPHSDQNRQNLFLVLAVFFVYCMQIIRFYFSPSSFSTSLSIEFPCSKQATASITF